MRVLPQGELVKDPLVKAIATKIGKTPAQARSGCAARSARRPRQLGTVAAAAPLATTLPRLQPGRGMLITRSGRPCHPSRPRMQVLIRWSLQKGCVCIPKSVKPDRVKSNADVFDFELGPEEMAALDGMEDGTRYCWDPTEIA